MHTTGSCQQRRTSSGVSHSLGPSRAEQATAPQPDHSSGSGGGGNRTPRLGGGSNGPEGDASSPKTGHALLQLLQQLLVVLAAVGYPAVLPAPSAAAAAATAAAASKRSSLVSHQDEMQLSSWQIDAFVDRMWDLSGPIMTNMGTSGLFGACAAAALKVSNLKHCPASSCLLLGAFQSVSLWGCRGEERGKAEKCTHHACTSRWCVLRCGHAFGGCLKLFMHESIHWGGVELMKKALSRMQDCNSADVCCVADVCADAVGWSYAGCISGDGPCAHPGAVLLQRHHSQLVCGAQTGTASPGHNWRWVSGRCNSGSAGITAPLFNTLMQLRRSRCRIRFSQCTHMRITHA